MEQSEADFLIQAAIAGMNNSYGVKPGKKNFGAAVKTNDGNIYVSGVYKSDTSTLTLHAEQAALAHAAAHGEYGIVAIAIVSNEDPYGTSFTNPCGLCKQLLYESAIHSGIPMTVILTNSQRDYQVMSLAEMIAYPWPSSKKG